MEFAHYSVLLKEAIDGLSVRPDGIYVDGTLGGGGHSLEIAKQLSQGGHLYGLDRDEDAIAAATKRLTDFADRITIVRSNYGDLKNVLLKENIEAVDGILLDLGVSSYQLDNEERGFSYRFNAPLDMRMDRHQTLTAREIVNDYPESELFRVIRDYGEERFAKSIARQIVKRRSVRPLDTTYDLNEAIAAAIPAKMRSAGGHPSKRTFQAIRIECNGELSVLSDSVEMMIGLLKPKGRLCIITFHSLEDRIVKNAMKRAENPCTCPPSFPVCVCGNVSKGTVITKKPILPSEQELNENSRSKSAKLRIFERGAL